MAVVAEYNWLEGRAGAVRVKTPAFGRVGAYDVIVAETDWVDTAGEGDHATVANHPGSSFTTNFAGLWITAFAANPSRQEAFIGNCHSDPSAVLFVRGGPYGPKPVWPDGPGFVTSAWKGSIEVMCPTHVNVRCSRSEV